MKDKELLEKAAHRFRVIAEDANRITSGNLSHNLPCLRGFALRAAESIERHLQEHASEDLEEYSASVADELPQGTALTSNGEFDIASVRKLIIDACKYGAKWGKNQAMAEIQAQSMALAHGCPEESESEDLERAAITAADEDMQGRQIMEESNGNRQLYSRIFRRGFKAGSKWHKEQMTSKAIDGRLYSTICGSEQNIVVPAGYGEYGKDGDKVKVIILKDE